MVSARNTIAVVMSSEEKMNNPTNTSCVHTLTDSQVENFDLVILGGGTGATIAAWTFAAEGMRVATIDRKYIGGIVPKHRVPAQQEHYSQRQGRIVFSPEQGVWHFSQWLHDRYDWRS